MPTITFLAIPLGVIGCALTAYPTAAPLRCIGMFMLLFGALAFIRGNRLKQAEQAERRHQETIEAIRQSKSGQ